MEVHLNHLLLNVVVASGGNVGDDTAGPRGEHDTMLDKRVFKHDAVYVSCRDAVPDLERGWVELPLLGDVEGWDCYSSGDEAVTACHCDCLEGALDSIKDVVEDAWAELNGKGLLGSRDEVADAETSSLLVDLRERGEAMSGEEERLSESISPS